MLPEHDIHAWIILISSLVITGAAIAGVRTQRAHETWGENLALTMTGFCSFMVALQVWATGYAHGNGLAWLTVSMACFALARIYAEWRRAHPSKRRRRHHATPSY